MVLRLLPLAVCGVVLFCLPAPSAAQSTHDLAWWQAVKDADYAVPDGESMPALAEELTGYLGSPDPVLRDEVAYMVLTQWIYLKRTAPVEVIEGLTSAWIANLAVGIGEDGTDSVLRRSFSAVMLSVVVARDNQDPFLDRPAFARLFDATLAYLRDERDTRGFDPGKGWLHSVAHTADVLKFMGRSRHLQPAEQRELLLAIAAKAGVVEHALAHGEDERLARAVISVVARDDFDPAALTAFLDALRPVPEEGLPTPGRLAVNQNRKHIGVSLYALLNTDPRDLESLAAARAATLAWLKTMM